MEQTLYPLGKITKTHGYNGTVVLVSKGRFDDELESLRLLYVIIDGLYVPFPVEEIALLSDTLAHVRLEFADNQNEALKLVGCQVSTDVPLLKQEKVAESQRWNGFTVLDSNYGKVGVIRKIDNYNGNTVMQIMDGKKEILISMFPELVTAIDEVEKILHITAPEGYFFIDP